MRNPGKARLILRSFTEFRSTVWDRGILRHITLSELFKRVYSKERVLSLVSPQNPLTELLRGSK